MIGENEEETVGRYRDSGVCYGSGTGLVDPTNVLPNEGAGAAPGTYERSARI